MKISIYKAVQIIDMVPVEMGKDNVCYPAAPDTQPFQLFINSMAFGLYGTGMMVFSCNLRVRHSCVNHDVSPPALHQENGDGKLYKALHIIKFVYAVVI